MCKLDSYCMSSVYAHCKVSFPTNAKAYSVMICHHTNLYFRIIVLPPNLCVNKLISVIAQTELLSHGCKMGSTGLVSAISAKSKAVEK